MGKQEENIREAIEQIALPDLAIEAIQPALVKSVSSDFLVDCTVDDLDVHNVRLKAIETGSNESLIIVPEDNTWVLIGSIEGTEEYVVLSVQKAKKVLCNVGGITMQIDSTNIKLNGDQHGNLLIESKLVDDLQKVNQFLTALKQVCSTPINEPGNGSPSAFQAALNIAIGTLSTPTYNGISNQKVKHG